MPQLIKVMDLKDLNEYVHLMQLDAELKSPTQHYHDFASHYEHFRNATASIPQVVQQASNENEQVYELIDDNISSNLINSLNTNMGVQQPQQNSTLLKRKYPKTNPNYCHSQGMLKK